MKVYVLMETDTDKSGPTVSVWKDAPEAIATAKFDIFSNGNKIIDEGYNGPDYVWTCRHTDPEGLEQISEVTEHEVAP